jgi:putative heme-binding domain-containing protein
MEKLHIAGYAPRLEQGWTTEYKIAFIKQYELARALEGGYSLSAYVENFAREFFAGFTADEKRQILRAGAEWPTSALSVLAALPPQPSAEVLADVRGLDRSLEGKPGDAIARLRVGTVAVLARSGETESLAYLRGLYQNAPERRPVIAMALTQDPAGDNWPILVDSLRIVEGPVAMEILATLARVNQKPSDAAAYRDAIVLGLKSDGETAASAARLLTHWTGVATSADLAQAQAWYARQFPDAPPATLPENSGRNRWSYEELVSFLDSDAGRSGDARRGMAAFKKAQCAACHRFGTYGESIGPDLTTVVRRFHTKEIVEAIVYPSHVISDQYASKLVEANGRTYNGLAVADGADTIVVLTSDGRQHRIPKSSVEAIEPSNISVMPDSLLNILTLEEVADLFAYLRSEPRVAEQSSAPSTPR